MSELSCIMLRMKNVPLWIRPMVHSTFGVIISSTTLHRVKTTVKVNIRDAEKIVRHRRISREVKGFVMPRIGCV